jgi:uncharacterized protein YbbC (DUF1343 family)
MNRMPRLAVGSSAILLILACASAQNPDEDQPIGPNGRRSQPQRILPGISVLMRDSLELLAGKKVGLLTNQTGIDENRVSDIDRFVQAQSSPRAAGMQLTLLFSPEHGIRGTEDRANISDEKDAKTGIPIISLYGNNVLPPPDSALDKIGALVIDLQDLGARPWTYVASMVYAVRAAAQHNLPVLVLDRPNPITGEIVEGPVLDSTVAYAGSQSPAKPAQPTALYPIPLRHGMTMGELARFYNEVLELHADLHVIPVQGWHRTMWFDRTKLPWVNPSPNITSLTAATLYPGIVILECANVSVGRGTDIPFQWVAAPWMDAVKVKDLLDDRQIPGVKFTIEERTPNHPTDFRYNGKRMKGIKITIVDRNALQTSRLGAVLLWSIRQVSGDSLKIDSTGFVHLFGLTGVRKQLQEGMEPEQIVDATLPAVVEFRQRARRFLLY